VLVFVIPLKSAQAAASWDVTTRLAARTIRSACAQTSPDFRVVVVCHEIPEIGVEDPRLEFLPVTFPPPAAEERHGDKARKLHRGLLHAAETGPCHAMILDADDCVSRRLAGHVTRHPASNGWYISKGYFYSEGMDTVRVERRRFHQWCGSSHIVRPEQLDLPGEVDHSWRLRHGPIASRMRRRGTPLEPLPFPGAVYCMSHGENFFHYDPILWSRNPLRRRFRAFLNPSVPLGDEIRDEFGLYPLEEAVTGAESCGRS
jgi:hypothetical protein